MLQVQSGVVDMVAVIDEVHVATGKVSDCNAFHLGANEGQVASENLACIRIDHVDGVTVIITGQEQKITKEDTSLY